MGQQYYCHQNLITSIVYHSTCTVGYMPSSISDQYLVLCGQAHRHTGRVKQNLLHSAQLITCTWMPK